MFQIKPSGLDSSKWIQILLNAQLGGTMAQLRRRSVTNPDKAPYQALVGFQRIVYSPIGDQELGREDLTSTIRFTFADKVERGMMQYNPPLVGAGPHMMQYNRLGLTVIDSTPIRRSLPKLEDYLCH